MKTRKPLSLLLVLCMIISLFAGMTVPASAAAVETVTIEITDKAGKTRTLATWTYDATNTTYIDSATGEELTLVKDFTKAENLKGTVNGVAYDFADLGMLVYSGANKKPDCRAWAVTAKGILLEDVFTYAGALLNAEKGTAVLKSDDVTLAVYCGASHSDAYSYSAYWGLTKYYYPAWLEKTQSEGTVSEADQTGGRVVPGTLAVIGYHGTGKPDLSAVTPDAVNALRSMQGQQQGGALKDVDPNLGFNSVYNIDRISFTLNKTFAEAGLDGEPGSCDHVWDDGVVVTPAKPEQDGVKEYTCKKCGGKKTEPVFDESKNMALTLADAETVRNGIVDLAIALDKNTVPGGFYRMTLKFVLPAATRGSYFDLQLNKLELSEALASEGVVAAVSGDTLTITAASGKKITASELGTLFVEILNNSNYSGEHKYPLGLETIEFLNEDGTALPSPAVTLTGANIVGTDEHLLTITAGAAEHGSIQLATTEEGAVPSNSLSIKRGNIKVVPTPDAGYALKALTLVSKSGTSEKLSVNATYTVGLWTMKEDSTIVPTFAATKTVTVDNTKSTNGTISCATSSCIVGDKCKVTFTPDTGYGKGTLCYQVEGSDEIVRLPNTNQFTMPDGNVTVWMEFAKLYNITPTVLPNASAVTFTSLSSAVAEGAEVSFRVTASGTFQIIKVEYSTDGIAWTEITKSGIYYKFPMPSANVAIRVTADLTLALNEKNFGAASVEKKSFTYDELAKMDEAGDFLYSGFFDTPAAFQGKAAVAAPLDKVLQAAGVSFSSGDKITLTPRSGTAVTLTYDELLGTERYYFPALVTGSNLESRMEGKLAVLPQIALSGEYVQNTGTVALNTPALVFGLSMAELSANADGSPSAGSLIAKLGKLKWIKAIAIEHPWNGSTIANAAEFAAFAAAVNAGDDFSGKTVTLADNIDLSSIADWTPVGSAEHPFAGTFDGAGKTVSGLTITDVTGGYHGLFGRITGTVKDFTVVGTIGTAESKITSGADNIGGAVGYNDGTVSGVTGNVTVYVNTKDIYAVGGIVGQNGQTGVIQNCANTADIEATKAAGGVCGRSYGKIDSCYNTGNITGNGGGKDGIGGIVGIAGDKDSTYANSVTNCYNTGTISNNNGRWHGGIVGMADSAATVKNCYNVGTIEKGYSWNWNPIIGHVDSAYSTVSNNYSLEGLNAGDTTDATKPLTIGTVKTADEMKSTDFVTLLGAAFKADTKPVNGGFPVLTWQPGGTSGGDDPTPSTPDKGDVNAPVWDGRSIDVSWYDPDATEYYISTPAQLAGLAAIVNGLYNKKIDTFKGDTSYIVANKVESEDSGPNGNNKSTGTYHYGADNFADKIVYLTADIDMGEDNNYMPIGGQYLMEKNDSTTRIDASFCGVFDGQGHSVTIYCDRHCSNGNYGDGSSVGLIGRLGVHDNEETTIPNKGATVRDVAVYGSVYANRSVGGVVGKTGKGEDKLIERCANFAAVKGTDSKGVGGIVGAGWNGVTIRDCYNAGAVETTYGTGATGGISGSNEATIINCYNVGTITGPAGNTTAAIATASGGDTYENCYWLTGSADVGVYNKTLASVTEKSAAELKSAEMLELLGSAFAADTANINNGYPVLYWQGPGASEPDPEEPIAAELPFTDVDGHWALDAIRYAYENKLFNGVSETLFAPDTAMTRGMLVTVLYRLEGEPAVTANAKFSDVAEDQWYAKAVAWAAENEIVKGYGATFGPDDLVTREQMATILLRYAVWKQYDTTAGKSLSDYADYAELSGWATAALEWANAEGLILGRTETTIVPQGDATRAEVATILMRFIEKFAEK